MSHSDDILKSIFQRLEERAVEFNRVCDERNKLQDEVYACQEHIGTLMTQIADLKADLAAVKGYLTSSQNEVIKLRGNEYYV